MFLEPCYRSLSNFWNNFTFWPCCVARGTLPPWPGIQPAPPALKVQLQPPGSPCATALWARGGRLQFLWAPAREKRHASSVRSYPQTCQRRAGCQPSKAPPEHLIPLLVACWWLLSPPLPTLRWSPPEVAPLRRCLLALEGTGSGWNLSQGWETWPTGGTGVWRPGQGCNGCEGSGKQWRAPCCWWLRWSLALPAALCSLSCQCLFEGRRQENNQSLCYSSLKIMSSEFHPSSFSIRFQI